MFVVVSSSSEDNRKIFFVKYLNVYMLVFYCAVSDSFTCEFVSLLLNENILTDMGMTYIFLLGFFINIVLLYIEVVN